MNHTIVHSFYAVLLVGGGDCDDLALKQALTEDLPAVAADGGARWLLNHKVMPDAVIGDMDSLDPALRSQIAPDRLHPVAEQDSTDFDKALRHIDAPLVLGYGFLGARLDHQLAALTVLARHPDRRCVLVGAHEVVVLCPPRLHLPISAGCRVSLWPLGPVTGRSEGLRWPIDGIDFAPARMGGTSNEALGPVTIQCDAPLMLLMLPVACLGALRAALEAEPATWPVRA